jgi:hypothetical protein
MTKFLSRQKLRHIEIEVVGVPGQFRNEGAYGFCSISDEHYGSGKASPVWFTIEIDTTLSMRDFLGVLCHELVHAKQYALKQLQERYYPTYRKFWKGIDVTDRYYSQSPFEQEAYRREKKLYLEFTESMHIDLEFIGPRMEKQHGSISTHNDRNVHYGGCLL